MSLLRSTIAFVVAGAATELLPIAFGTGTNASSDWSFLYVTSRFILLPVAAVVLVVSAVRGLVQRRHVAEVHATRDALAAAAIASAYLLASYLDPLPWLERLL